MMLLLTSETLCADPPVEQDKPGPSSRDLTAAHSLSKNMEASSLISSDLLALDMSMLAVDGGCQTHKNQESPQNVPPLQSLEPYWGPGGSGDSRPALPARVGAVPRADAPACPVGITAALTAPPPLRPSIRRGRTWPTSSRVRPRGCWCQTWRCSPTSATSARRFFPGTPAPGETFYATFTPTSLKIGPPLFPPPAPHLSASVRRSWPGRVLHTVRCSTVDADDQPPPPPGVLVCGPYNTVDFFCDPFLVLWALFKHFVGNAPTWSGPGGRGLRSSAKLAPPERQPGSSFLCPSMRSGWGDANIPANYEPWMRDLSEFMLNLHVLKWWRFG